MTIAESTAITSLDEALGAAKNLVTDLGAAAYDIDAAGLLLRGGLIWDRRRSAKDLLLIAEHVVTALAQLLEQAEAAAPDEDVAPVAACPPMVSTMSVEMDAYGPRVVIR
jgi:hypothetical protein